MITDEIAPENQKDWDGESLGEGVTEVSRVTVTPDPTENNDTLHTPTITTFAHGRDWTSKEVERSLNRSIRPRVWSVRGPAGQIVTDSHCPPNMAPMQFFLRMFPPAHLAKIVESTNRRLSSRALRRISTGELLRFSRFTSMRTRVEFSARRSLWN